MNKYIIYSGSPIPSEMEGTPMLSGTLASRLAAFEAAVAPGCILPLTDIEMNGLARSPELFPLHEALVIIGLPGVPATPIFDAAVATAGLRTVFWDELKSSIRGAALEQQRTRETRPWQERESMLGQGPAVDPELEDSDPA